MKVDGACHCGKVTFEAEVDPENIIICHCTDCQLLSGGPYRPLARSEEGSFRLLSGEVKVYVKTGESGAPRAQAFCPECGTPIYASAMEENPTIHNIRLSTIRQHDELRPRKQIWGRSKQGWINDLSALPEIEKQP